MPDAPGLGVGEGPSGFPLDPPPLPPATPGLEAGYSPPAPPPADVIVENVEFAPFGLFVGVSSGGLEN